jgi:acyl-CoA synthetase (NDP forming)
MTHSKDRLKRIFSPRSIAFLGATNNHTKWGYIVLSNLLNGDFHGNIYPINPHEKEILGIKVYSNLAKLPETPDMAVIIVPPSAVLQVIKDCVDKGIKAGLIITAGFAELGDRGQEMQDAILNLARKGGMVLVGPNSNGIMGISSQFYCTMPPLYPQPGNLSLVSQSGNLAATLSGNIIKRGLGISCYVSSGNEADLHTEDFLEYLMHDENTKVILSYVEGFKDGKRFFQIAKQVARLKPILMLKGGDTPAGANAAKSHTAAVAGADSIIEAAFKQAGIIRVHTIEELLDYSGAFISQPLPKGNRLGIITLGGGWGVLVADFCTRRGLKIAHLSKDTLNKLDKYLPSWWTRSNPVDMVGGMRGKVDKILEILLSSDDIDGIIILGLTGGILELASKYDSLPSGDELGRVAVENFAESLKEVIELRNYYNKPVIVANNFPVGNVEGFEKIFQREAQNIFCYTTPHQAAAAYVALTRYANYLYGID